MESEEKVYEGVIGWIKHDNDIINREKHAEELFCLLKFSVMPSEFLSEVVAKETILRSLLVVMQAVLSAIGNHQPQKSAQEEQNKKHDKKSPSQKENRMPDLPLSGFLAVDQSAIWKVVAKEVKKTNLKYDHSGGLAVCWGRYVFVISGSRVKSIEQIDMENLLFV